MKKLTLALAALALGAGAVYLLDPREGPRRRRELGERAREWMDALEEGATTQMQALGGWVEGVQQRRSRDDADRALRQDDGLAPLEMTPPPLEDVSSRRSRMLPALAVATPVAVAVGAALWRYRDEDRDGPWLH